MKKKKKKNKTMIDMSERLKVIVIENDIENDNTIQEFEEITHNIEEKTNAYQKHLMESLIDKCKLQDVNMDECKENSYYISQYEDQYKNKNSDNIKNILELYKQILKEE